MAIASRLNINGNLQVSGSFDELTNVPSTFGSLSFNGSTDYIQGTVTAPGTNDFTIEGWVYFRSFTQNTATPFSILAGGSSSGFEVYYNGTGWGVRNNTANFFSPAATAYTILPYSWYHVAFVRSSGVFTLYINGVSIVTSSTARTTTDTTMCVGSWVGTANTFFNGLICNVRYSATTAFYKSNFTPSTLPPTAIAGTTVLLNTFTVPSNAAFLDSSSSPVTFTKTGSPTSSNQTPLNPIGYYNNYFNSANPDWLTTVSTYTISSGDYTIECWAYGINTGASQQGIFTLTAAASAGASGISVFVNTSNSISFFVNGNSGANVVNSANQVFLPSVWNHVALVGSSGTNTLYVNGLSVASNVKTPTVVNFPVNIGRQYGDNSSQTWNGYISNFRLVIGNALYITTFNPSNVPLTAVANTKLLTCQSNQFVDKSVTASTFTKNGNTAINSNTAPLPFSSYNYSGTNVPVQRLNSDGTLQIPNIFDEVSLQTGSISFDGYTQSLTLGGQSNFAFGTNDFTIEYWFNINSNISNIQYQTIDFRPFGTASILGYLVCYLDTNKTITFTNGVFTLTGPTASFNTWYHYAVSRVSGITRLFVNGVQYGSSTSDSQSYSVGSSRPIIGTDGNNPNSLFSGNYYTFSGYLSNVRILNGTGLYNNNFTPQLSVLPNVTNTSLLLNVINSTNFITDSSTNGFTVTNNGSATFNTNGPFNKGSANIGQRQLIDGTFQVYNIFDEYNHPV
jgi:hypothetical protein